MDINWFVRTVLITFFLVAIILLCTGCYLCWRFDKATYVTNYNYGSNNSFRRHEQEFNDFELTGRPTDADILRVVQELQLQSSNRSTASRQRSQNSSISSRSHRSSGGTTPRRIGSIHVSPFHVPHDIDPGFLDDEDGYNSYTSRRTSDVGSIINLNDLPNYDAVSDQPSIQESPPSYADCVVSNLPQLLLSPATPEPDSP